MENIANISKIVKKDIQILNEADYNPRILSEEQYKNIKESIKRFGFVDPVIININKNRENVIIGGHQRVRVAKELNIKEIPCVELNLSEKKERELNIRLNKNLGQWDFDILANEFDLDELLDWGFKEYELNINVKSELNKMDEWEGMPEFDNDDLKPYKQIRVSFQCEEDMQAFAKLVGNKITEKTKSIWYPKMEKESVKDLEYIDES